jgi:K+-transporting ATPase ATPase C chain
MIKQLKPALILFALLTLLTGVIYPLTVTGLAQTFFSHQANGSLIRDSKGQAVGSSLIGQQFSRPEYFWGRPSATTPFSYNAAASSGSNLTSTSFALLAVIKNRVTTLKAFDNDNKTGISVDLLTASASGLDPHISLAAANYQMKRVAKMRHIAPEKLQALIGANTEFPAAGVLGDVRVNVLQLNLTLSDVM